jgi:hypothetical protein
LEVAQNCRTEQQNAAVAYFGQGASKLLPLSPSSRLVVDASDGAVKSGQTCPADLKVMQKHGVTIYSVPNLHAKVYAFDGFAFIGSANASNHSRDTLLEAMIQTNDPAIVRSAKSFVRGLCLNELSPGILDRLSKIYRPPRFLTAKKSWRHKKNRKITPVSPRLLLAQLRQAQPPEESEATEEKGLGVARKRRRHGSNYRVDSSWWTGESKFREGDKVIQVIKDERGRRFVDPPADVLHKRSWHREPRPPITFIYFEQPDKRRIRLGNLARRMGRGARKNY